MICVVGASWWGLAWWGADQVSAAASIATVVVGAGLGFVGYRISKGQREVAGLMVLREVTNQFFNTKALLGARSDVTHAWREGEARGQPGVTDEQDPSLRLILNCFQDAAIYVERKHVPAQVVWDCLSYWVLVYWYVAQAYVTKTRADTLDHTSWFPVQQLVDKLHRRAKHQGLADWAKKPEPEMYSVFFEREADSLNANTLEAT